jgi:hypothetical protein
MRLAIVDVAGRALFRGEAPVTHVHQLPALLAQHYPSDGVHFYHFVFAHGGAVLGAASALPEAAGGAPLELLVLVAPLVGTRFYIVSAFLRARLVESVATLAASGKDIVLYNTMHYNPDSVVFAGPPGFLLQKECGLTFKVYLPVASVDGLQIRFQTTHREWHNLPCDALHADVA